MADDLRPVLPLLDGGLDGPGLIDPRQLHTGPRVPTRAVACFFAEVLDDRGDAVHSTLSVQGGRPLYVTEHHGREVGLFYPGLGAPAAASAVEELIARGCTELVAVGGAGALVDDLALGRALVVTDALRDEGTSHHYLPPGRLVAAHEELTVALAATLERTGVPYARARTWTTDALYRETRDRVRLRVDEGCVVVEMEAAAMMAVARFRGVALAQLLYAGDTLAGEQWDDRGWLGARDTRSALLEVALDTLSP